MSEVGHVTHLQHDGKELFIVGTAHISQKSVEEVRRVIAEIKPDTVCVELDAMRLEALTDEDRWKKLDIFAVIKQKKVLFLLASIVLSAYQRRMGEALGVQPGAELLAAVNSAESVGAELVLADRDIQATLKRTWGNLGFFNKIKMRSTMSAAFFGANEISEEDIEELKDKDNINEMVHEFAKVMPQVQGPLIDERDQYLMHSIQNAPGDRIVGVVGAAHVPGMKTYLGKDADIEALNELPGPSKVTQVLKWVIPVIVLSAFGYGYYKHQGEGLMEMLFAWVLPNSVMAALFSLLAGAKPLTILTAFIASPITSLNPTIGAGMAAGLVEAWLRKPTVADCERINDDMLSWRGLYRNQFTRVLLVAVAATVGSALGAWVGGAWVVSLIK